MVGKDAVNAAAIVLGTMKMDDAMIVPTLIIVASRRPSSGRRPSSPAAAVTWLIGCPKLAPAPAGRYPAPSAHTIATFMGDPAPMRRTAPLLLALLTVPAQGSAQAAPAPAAPAQPAQPDTADHLRPGLFAGLRLRNLVPRLRATRGAEVVHRDVVGDPEEPGRERNRAPAETVDRLQQWGDVSV